MVWSNIRRYLRNPYFARTPHDRAAFCVLLVGAQLSLWYETCHVMPYYHAGEAEISLMSIMHVVMALFLYVSSLANVYKMIRTRTVCDVVSLGVVEDVSWPYCERCLIHRPPRTHHCPVCDVCVMKRDHHCWFGGCCVGHTNYRYYICAICYMFTAALYANIYHWSFMLERLEHLGGIGTAICITIPHFCAMFGYLTLYQFLVCVLSFVALLLVVMFAWLLVIQIAEISRGQTRHERKLHDFSYDHGLLENIRGVMGERWYIAWLWPWISSPLPENGVVFRICEVKTK